MNQVYMGYSREDITPDYPVQIVGYDARPDNTSRGVLDRLAAQVSVWKTEKETCCLIAIDSLGFTVELAAGLRNRVAGKLHTVPEKVMLCFSHTHAAPNAGTEKEYYEFVCERILRAAGCAARSMVPVKAAWGTALNTVGVNRRGNSQAFDNRLGILKISGEEPQDLKLILLRVTAHANVLMPDNWLLSADYFGAARKLLEKEYGCGVILIQGPSGDVRPRYRQENADFLEIHPAEAAKQKLNEKMKDMYWKQSMESLEKMACEIFCSADPVLKELSPKPIEKLSMFSVSRSFYADVPSPERALDIAAEALTYAGIDGKGWLNEVRRLNENHVKRQSCSIEIQYFAVGDGCICGVPNEIMSDLALEVQKKSGYPLLFFNGYTNGCTSYLPTAEEYDKGGYEVLWSNLLYYLYHGRVMALNRDTAMLLENETVQRWNDYIKNQETD